MTILSPESLVLNWLAQFDEKAGHLRCCDRFAVTNESHDKFAGSVANNLNNNTFINMVITFYQTIYPLDAVIFLTKFFR